MVEISKNNSYPFSKPESARLIPAYEEVGDGPKTLWVRVNDIRPVVLEAEASERLLDKVIEDSVAARVKNEVETRLEKARVAAEAKAAGDKLTKYACRLFLSGAVGGYLSLAYGWVPERERFPKEWISRALSEACRLAKMRWPANVVNETESELIGLGSADALLRQLDLL